MMIRSIVAATHQGAVDELVAQHIVTGQEKDIAHLKDWLAKHGK